LEDRGSRLIVRRGPTSTALDELIQQTKASGVFWNRVYRPPMIQRDSELKSEIRKRGVAVETFNGSLLFEPGTILNTSGKPFSVFTSFWRACLAKAVSAPAPDPPPKLRAPESWVDSLQVSELGLQPAIDWAGGLRDNWQPGEKGAKAQLDLFRQAALASYGESRDHPGVTSTSRLSPHLRFGEISARQIWHAIDRFGGDAFLRQLGWRELIRPALAAKSALLSTTIFLSGGIIGTCHHLYFCTPTVALAFGSVFSALEVVPLTMVAYSAIEDLRNGRLAPRVQRYRWPIYYFVAVAFWNMVGAGLFGFMINPPIALYYMQGLNTTPLHGHAALFGVYGMLGIGLMLVCLRAMDTRAEWKESWLKVAFWRMNSGLFIMCVGSLLPVGLAQTWASVEKGYWYARSTEFLGLPFMQTLRWMRVPGDTIFAIAALVLVAFVFTGRGPAVSQAKELAGTIRVPAGD
jgi:hypothetical protein